MMAWRFFIIGNGSNFINKFSLRTPFDVSTFSGSSQSSIGIHSQDNRPRGIAFSEDGLKLFIIGNQNDSIYQYTMSTPFDITTLFYSDSDNPAVSLPIGDQETSPQDIVFSNDGSKMFIIGKNRIAYEYSLEEQYSIILDETGPVLSDAEFTDASTITIQTDEDVTLPSNDPFTVTLESDSTTTLDILTSAYENNVITLTTTTPATNGEVYTITIPAITDVLGNARTPDTLTITRVPIAPVFTTTNSTTVNTASFDIEGTTEAGTTVSLTVGSVSVDALIVGTDWTATVTLSEGSNTITATASDGLNPSVESSLTVTLDTVVPIAPVFTTTDSTTVNTPHLILKELQRLEQLLV